jgi:hypothetical protein
VAEENRELTEKQLAEKNSEFIREKVDLVEKRRKDGDTLKNLQADVQALRTYMTQAEQGWDLMNADVMGKYLEPKLVLFYVTLNDVLS